MRSITLSLDDMGRPLSAIPPSDHVNLVVLSAGVAKQIVTPADSKLVIFNATGTFWAHFGGAATLPVADVLNGSAPELNPYARTVAPDTTIGLVSVGACQVSISFYG